MAYRRSRRKTSFYQLRQVLPVWSTVHTDTATLAFQELLSWIGISGIPSYFQRLRSLIVISVLVCAVYGGIHGGATGFLLGGLSGVLAPAAVLWLGVMVVALAIYLGIYLAAWAVIWLAFEWCLSELFRL